MLDFNDVVFLYEGYHKYEKGTNYASSNIVLIKGKKNIIIDTGYFGDETIIVSSLKKHDLKVDDIDFVLITHWHFDHIANTNLFKNAIVIKGSYTGNIIIHDPIKHGGRKAEPKDLKEFKKIFEVIKTPGHTSEHLAFLFKTNKGNVIAAGDAIPLANFIDCKKQPIVCQDIKLFNKSRSKILKLADWIIPGHSPMIKIKK
jgi:glyoxylase-like metal-dependent hydrolase (beta-lactamase superfamily II)